MSDETKVPLPDLENGGQMVADGSTRQSVSTTPTPAVCRIRNRESRLISTRTIGFIGPNSSRS